MRRRPRNPLPKRRLRQESDGSLYDVDERRRVELSELCEDVRSGRFFRAARHTSGENCTQEVLAKVLAAGVPKPPQSGGAALAGMVTGVLSGIVNGLGSKSEPVGVREQPRADVVPVREQQPRPRTPRRTQSTGQREWWEGD
jgi:hypothetical protein